MLKEVLVIGEYESVIIYKTFGCEVVVYNDEFNITKFIKELNYEKYKIIFLVDDVYAKFQDSINSDKTLSEKIKIPVIPIVGIKNKNFASEKYNNLSKIATGIKLHEGDKK